MSAKTTRLTTKDLLAAFAVTPMTIANWRAGTPTRTPLPCKKEGRSVFYQPAAIKRWAEKNNVPLAKPESLSGGSETVKPGPKARRDEEAL